MDRMFSMTVEMRNVGSVLVGKPESDELCDSVVIGRIILKLMLGNRLLECTTYHFSSGHR